MTSRNAAVLIRLIAADSPMTALEIGRDSGLYSKGNDQTWKDLGQSLIYPLVRLRAAAKCGRKPMSYEVTEKGRIAVALFRVISNRKERRRSDA